MHDCPPRLNKKNLNAENAVEKIDPDAIISWRCVAYAIFFN